MVYKEWHKIRKNIEVVYGVRDLTSSTSYTEVVFLYQ